MPTLLLVCTPALISVRLLGLGPNKVTTSVISLTLPALHLPQVFHALFNMIRPRASDTYPASTDEDSKFDSPLGEYSHACSGSETLEYDYLCYLLPHSRSSLCSEGVMGSGHCHAFCRS